MANGQHARARKRSGYNKEFLALLPTLLTEELINLRAETAREIGIIQSSISDLRSRIDLIREELDKRTDQQFNGFRITDHAVVRYLQRHKGIDMDAVRQEIAEIASRSKPTRNNGVRTIARKDDETALSLGISEGDHTVTTVFQDRELVALHVVTP